MGGCQARSTVEVRPYYRQNVVMPRGSTGSLHSINSIVGAHSVTKVFDEILRDINQDKLKLYDFRTRLSENNVQISKLLEPTLLNHQLILLLKKSLDTALEQWNSAETRSLDDANRLTFRNAAVFLSDIAEHFGNRTPTIIYQPFLLNMPFLKVMVQCLESMATNGTHLTDPSHEYNLESFTYLLNIFRNFETQSGHSIDEIKSISPLLASVSSLIRSRYYTETFLQLSPNAAEFSVVQRFLLDKCPTFLNAYKGKHSSDIHDTLLEQMFDRYVQILEHFLPHVEVWRAPVISAITHIIDTMVNASFAAQAHVFHQPKIIEHALTILRSQRLCSKLSSKEMTQETWLINSILTGLHNMIYDSKLLAIIKRKTVTPVFIQITTIASYDRILVHAYLILAGILNEAEIRELGNGKEITTIFLRYLSKAMESRQKMFKGVTLLAMLCGLKSMSFSDWTNPERLLLSNIIFKTSDQELAHALSTVWTLSFNNDVAATIRKKSELINKIQLLAANPTQETVDTRNKETSHGASEVSLTQPVNINSLISSAAEGILWQVQGEAASNERQRARKENVGPSHEGSTKKKYDVMISYSHEDKALCHRIADSLTNDGFNVWIDKNNMTGSTPVAIADGIENSGIVLIAMTYSYKVSPWCQREGSYAFQRQTKIIPMKLPPAYTADGWLGLLVASLNYINFAKLDFDIAYEQLKSEIKKSQNGDTDAGGGTSPEAQRRQHAGVKVTDEPAKKKSFDEEEYVYPPQSDGLYATMPIQSWTPQHVHDFLNDKRLYPVLLLCKNMDGPALYQLYKFCIDNSTVAFESLQRKLEKKFDNYDLSPVEYTQFISEIKKISPTTSPAV